MPQHFVEQDCIRCDAATCCRESVDQADAADMTAIVRKLEATP